MTTKGSGPSNTRPKGTTKASAKNVSPGASGGAAEKKPIDVPVSPERIKVLTETTPPPAAPSGAIGVPAPVSGLADYVARRMAVFQPDAPPNLVDIVNENNRQIALLESLAAAEMDAERKARLQALAEKLKMQASGISELVNAVMQKDKLA